MKRLLLIGAAAWMLAAPALAAPSAPATLDYVVVSGGKLFGRMAVNRSAGARTVHYEAKNNGRGPSLDMSWTLDAAGLPTTFRAGGDTGIGVAPDESLASPGGVLTWRSSAQGGQSRERGFYLPDTDAPENLALLARALRLAKSGRTKLLPAGEASLELLETQTVTRGGERRQVELVLVKGVDLAPIALWLDADNELFAQVSANGFSTVRAGWEASATTLLATQQRLLQARDYQLARTLGRMPEGPTVFRHVDVFDAEAKAMRRDMRVVIAGERIASVAADDASPQAPGQIDGRGRSLMPGLWDMHVHIASNLDGLMNVANGVLAARDMGNDVDTVVKWRSDFESGALIGPRLSLAGLVDGRAATSNDASIKVTNPQELAGALDLLARNQYVELKIYSSFPPDLLPAAIAGAHANSLRVGGHVPAGVRMDDVVRLGFDDVSHLNFTLLDFLGDDVQKRTNSLERMLAPARLGASIDLDDPKVAASIALWCERGLTIDPTAIVLEGLFTSMPGEVTTYLRPYAERLPPTVVRASRGGGLAKSEAERTAYTASFRRGLEILKRFHDCGGKIVPGTDGMAGFMLPHELELYVQAGLPTLDVLQAATLTPARMMRRDAELGSIAPGKLADVFLVRGDPSANIGVLRDIDLVVRNGKLFDPAELDRAIGLAPQRR